MLGRHRKKEQRFGPSPANNYTSGYGAKFGSLFQRRGTTKTVDDPNALPMHTDPNQLRQSYVSDDATTKYGETTMANGTNGVGRTYGNGAGNYGLHHGAPVHHEPAPPVGATTNGFGNVPGHAPAERYGDGTYNV